MKHSIPSLVARSSCWRGPWRQWTAGLLLLALALAPARVRAEDVEEAKRHFAAAETAYKLGDYLSAITSYEAAYKAMPEPAFLFNIAQAHRQQYALDHDVKHLHRALSLYKTYLREADRARNRETVRKLIDELKQIIQAVQDRASQEPSAGRLELKGAMAEGATVTLDGKPWGRVPKNGEVSPGTHLIQVTKKGYEPWSSTVEVTAGSRVELPVMLLATARGHGRGVASVTPVYKKWWFWTVVGVAVAGAGLGTGLGVYYGSADQNSVPAMPTIDLR